MLAGKMRAPGRRRRRDPGQQNVRWQSSWKASIDDFWRRSSYNTAYVYQMKEKKRPKLSSLVFDFLLFSILNRRATK